LPDEYVQKMVQGIVGFEIQVTRLEGKFKLSQNRTASEQETVIAALHDHPDSLSMGVAELMGNPKK
jgi:transcriptional regulator